MMQNQDLVASTRLQPPVVQFRRSPASETILLIETYVRMVWRNRWFGLLTASLICIAGWSVVLLLPDRYEVSTRVFVDSGSTLRPLLRGIALDSNTRAQTAQWMRQSLLVRPNLEVLVRETDMDLKARTPEEYETLLKDLSAEIKISGTDREDVFVIAYGHPDPKLATRLVGSLLDLFVERSLKESRKDSGTSADFIDAQIAEYETKLVAAEVRLKKFKQKNVGKMPAEGQNYFTELQEVSSKLDHARLKLREARSLRDELKRQVDGIGVLFDPLITETRTQAPHQSDEQIRRIEAQLDDLLLRFTEKHPDVVSARSRLRRLKRQRMRELDKQPVKITGVQKKVANPLYQEMKASLGLAEAKVAELETRVAEYEGRVREYQHLVDTIFEIEADLSKLNRDYSINKVNYDELVKRRESLRIADKAAQTSDSFRFKVLEPPKEPLLPAGPKRYMFNAAVLFAGLGAGVGLAWLLAMLKPAFYSKQGFADITDLPVLGHVSQVWTPGEVRKRHRRHTYFVLGCLTLFGLYVGFTLAQRTGIAADLRALAGFMP